jgi:hypothetical protein
LGILKIDLDYHVVPASMGSIHASPQVKNNTVATQEIRERAERPQISDGPDACSLARGWKTLGPEPMTLAVNVAFGPIY